VLSQDFKEFIESLNSNDVRYLVIGGYALAAHGCPRYTKNLDIWLDNSQMNAERIIKSLIDFGFGSLTLAEADFTAKDRIIQLGYPPNRIDLLTSADGVDFEECYSKRVSLRMRETVVDFIDVEGLRMNKRATGRAQDLADLEALDHET
jgi:hypothetical protein